MSETPHPYAHWMLREMFEQPETLGATLAAYTDGKQLTGDTCNAVAEWIHEAKEIVIVASGSSRHAGMIAEILIEDCSGLPVDVEYASEYTFRPERAMKQASVLVVSQSGETADTLASLRHASANGHRTLAITNAPTSTMAREAHVSFPTLAGKERAVPATKSFTGQLLNISLLALLAGQVHGTLDASQIGDQLSELHTLPVLIEKEMQAWHDATRELAGLYQDASSMLFLGRGVHYPIAREGALKLKESAYLHAEGYPSGELKHGPNALVSEGTPLVMLATVDESDIESAARYEKVVTLMRDMRKQNATIIAIANDGDNVVEELATSLITVPPVSEALLPFCELIPLQLLSYFMAIGRGINVDQPRNLTKAVLQD